MGKLFWKFLIAFWGCLIIAALLAVISLRFLETPRGDVQLAEGPRAQLLLETAEAVIRVEGPEGLKRMLTRMGRRMEGPLPLFAINEDGHELLGREVPEDMAERFADDLERPTPPQQGLVKADAPNGERWALFVLRPLRKPQADHMGDDDHRESHRSRNPDDVKLLLGFPPQWVFAVAGLAGLLFAAVLAHNYSKPFTRLKEGFAQVAAGKLNTRLATGMQRNDEVGDLLRGFDTMASELETQINQQKALLHDVSHELRSPLARLSLAVGLARQSPAQVEASLTRIEQESERLDELIGQLLKLSRLESDAHRNPFVEVDVIEVLDNVLQDARFEAEQKGRHLHTDISIASWPRQGNPDALYSAVENVVRNAIRHTPEGGNVWVRVAALPAEAALPVLTIEVQDEGGGIDATNLPKLFDAFFKQGKHDGHGLGLAIVKRAVLLHGGNVSARNCAGGLVVCMEIPQV